MRGITLGIAALLLAVAASCGSSSPSSGSAGSAKATETQTRSESVSELQPIRHYDDGSVNDSALDELHVDTVPAHGTWKGRSQPFKYKAHEHEVVGCGLDPSSDLGEQRIRVVH